MAETIAGAVRKVTDRVAAAAERAGRGPGEVTIVGAVKYVDEVEEIAEAVAAGIGDLGENTAQKLAAKAEALGEGPRWHYLGAIQTNKVGLLDEAVLLHGLYRDREGAALHRRAEALDRTYDVLIEVNLGGEVTKQGIGAAQVGDLLERLQAYPRVRPRGFMFVAPAAENPEDVRWLFTEGRHLRERYEGFGLEELSMGMTDDFEVAVEEGATIVRIGRAIFRPEQEQ